MTVSIFTLKIRSDNGKILTLALKATLCASDAKNKLDFKEGKCLGFYDFSDSLAD